ncbi:MAG: sel1 repeat family protein [Alphaproteobacteria bacterium]|nr:sel1 repeat family protein [Alphaproteobacteria bacterium]
MKKTFFYVLLFSTISSLSFADYVKGLEAFQKADYTTTEAELRGCLLEKDAKCQYLTAFMLYHGLGGPQSYERAFSLFEAAAEQGHTEARTFLGYMYDEGKGVRRNRQKAFELYQQSADEFDVTAIMNLGVLYYRGEGVPQNYEKAFELLNSIESVKHPILQFYLGNLYFYGYGVAKNATKAFTYYKRAAQLKSVEAHYMLGHMYQNGIGVEQNMEKARSFYEYAAVMGFPMAQFNLATMYADGLVEGGVNKIQAYAWMSEAAKNNFDKANSALELLSDSMSSSDISRAKSEGVTLNKRVTNKEVDLPIKPEEDDYVIAPITPLEGVVDKDKARPRPKRSQRLMRRR